MPAPEGKPDYGLQPLTLPGDFEPTAASPVFEVKAVSAQASPGLHTCSSTATHASASTGHHTTPSAISGADASFQTVEEGTQAQSDYSGQPGTLPQSGVPTEQSPVLQGTRDSALPSPGHISCSSHDSQPSVSAEHHFPPAAASCIGASTQEIQQGRHAPCAEHEHILQQPFLHHHPTTSSMRQPASPAAAHRTARAWRAQLSLRLLLHHSWRHLTQQAASQQQLQLLHQRHLPTPHQQSLKGMPHIPSPRRPTHACLLFPNQRHVDQAGSR